MSNHRGISLYGDRKKKAPKNCPDVPRDIFTESTGFVLVVPSKGKTFPIDDILLASDVQRGFDPILTFVLRLPDRVVVKLRNGTSNDLKRLVKEYGGHL